MTRFALLTLLAPAGCTLLFEPPPGAAGRDAASDGSPTEDATPAEDANADGAPPGADGGGGFVPLCPPGDRVAHWNFNADPLTIIEDVEGGHDGEVVDYDQMIDRISSEASPRGRAGVFEIPPSDGDVFVKVPDDDLLDLTVGSIEVWVRYHSSNTNQQAVARDAQFSQDGGHFRIRRLQDEKVYVRLQGPGCTNDDAELCSLELEGAVVQNNEWAQIVVNFGCTSAECKVEFFLDGALQGNSTEEYSFETAGNPFVFGTDQGNAPEGPMTGDPNEYLDGAIDEIVLCDTWVDPG